MTGNASRYSHQRSRRYTQVLLDMGAMVTDADQAESQALATRNVAVLGDAAIRTGVPKSGGVLRYANASGPADVATVVGLRPGKVVADGQVGEVRLASGQALTGLGMDLLTKQADLIGGPALPGNATSLCLFADLWQRHVGPAEDARLVDPAFLSANSSTRLEQMAQIKFAPIASLPSEAELAAAVESPSPGLPVFGDLRLRSADFENAVVTTVGCDDCATALTDEQLDAGNHLFRLEIHDSPFNVAEIAGVTARPAATAHERIVVKFSRDNGATEVAASAALSLAADPVYANAVFEVVGLVGEQRLGLASPGADGRRSTLVNRAGLASIVSSAGPNAIVRVWDGAVTLDLAQANLAPQPVGALTATGTLDRSGAPWVLTLTLGGLRLRFEATPRNGRPFILPGDAWPVEIREYAATDAERLRFEAEPVQVEHRYAFLGHVRSGAFVNAARPDLRARAFPALTEIAADDVAWSNHHHPTVQANTVQGAIDLLFAREDEGECLCTFCIDPERSLAEQLKEIAGKAAGTGVGVLICIPVGRYLLDAPVEFADSPGVTLRGAGLNATIIEVAASGGEAAITATDCGWFGVEDLQLSCVKPKAPIILKGEGVGILSVDRVAWRVIPRGDRFCYGVVAEPSPSIKEQRGAVRIARSHFFVADMCVGVCVRNLASDLTVTECSFAGTWSQARAAGKLFDRARKIVKAAKLVDAAGAGRKDGVVAIEGLDKVAIDIGKVAEDDGKPAEEFWGKAMPMLRATPALGRDASRVKVFDAIRGALGEAFDLMEAFSDALGDRKVGPARRPDILTHGGDPAAVKDPLFLGFDARTLALLPEKLVEETRTLFAKAFVEKATVKDFALVAGALRDDAVKVTAAPPSYGVVVESNQPIDNLIVGNRFEALAVAVALAGGQGGSKGLDLAPPTKTTLRDNVVERPIGTVRLDSKEFGFDTPWAVTLSRCGSIDLENNVVAQTPGGGGDDIFLKEVVDPGLDPLKMHFAAIGVTAIAGPRIRASGNSAHNFRHCLYVDCDPTTDAAFQHDMLRQNFWSLSENCVLPVFPFDPKAKDRAHWAVEFGQRVVVAAKTGFIRIVGQHNHPESPFFQ